MRWRLLCSFAVLTVALQPSAVWADGCVLKKGGGYVQEHEQRAFIDLHGGIERLWLATHTAAADGPTLWIVPIPGRPDDVLAEPVQHFPAIDRYRDIIRLARRQVKDARDLTLTLNLGLFPFCCAGMASKGDMALGGRAGDVSEHRRIEKHGMVVTIISAKTKEGLDAYLRQNEVQSSAAQLTSFAPYFNDDFVLICSWSAQSGEQVTARGVRIEFPADDVYYPLRPSQVYPEKIATSIYVRGLWRPQADSRLRAVRCDYVHARVKMDEQRKGEDWPAHDILLTRIEVGGLPSEWQEDLHLRRGARYGVILAAYITGYHWETWVRAILGIVLASPLPLIVIPRERRRWFDWLWAAAVGGGIIGSVYLSLGIFCVWCVRRAIGARKEGEFKANFAIGAAVLLPFMFPVLLIILALQLGRGGHPILLLVLAFMPAAIFAVFGSLAFALIRFRVLWLLLFVGLHTAAFLALAEWAEHWLLHGV